MKKPLKYWTRDEGRGVKYFIAAYSAAQAVRMMKTIGWFSSDYLRDYYYETTGDEKQPLVKKNGIIVVTEEAKEVKAIKEKTKFKVIETTSTYSRKRGATPKRFVLAFGLSKEAALDKMFELTGERKEEVTRAGSVFPKHYTIE